MKTKKPKAIAGRWYHIKAKRPVKVVADRGTHVDFHYIQGLGGSALFKRGVTPVQTLPRAEFEKFFKPQVTDG